MIIYIITIQNNHDGGGHFQSLGTSPTSVIISLWQLHVVITASGEPIPLPLGSPAGPNQWF